MEKHPPEADMRPILPILLLLAGCAPRVYHREVQRPVATGAAAYACAVRETERLGYEVRDVNPGSEFAAVRERPQPEGARYGVYDYLAVDVKGEATARVLRIGAVTLAGGGGGVHPHFRAPHPQTEADRDAVLDACAGRAASS
jgi:hypothetical protein